MRLPLSIACSLLAAAPAAAIPFVPAVTIGATGGTLGIGPEVSYGINPFVAIRGSATFLKGSGHGTSNGYRYNGRAKISNYGASIDVYPLANGFRLSAGARYTRDNRIHFTGRATTTRSYSGVIYTPQQAGTLSGTIRAKKLSPLLSAGYAHAGLSGLMFGIDGGVMFHGTPKPHDFTATGQLATNPGAQTEYANQQQRVRNGVDGYKYYPILQASIGYRF